MVLNGIVVHVSGENHEIRDPKSRRAVGFALATRLEPLHRGQYLKVAYDRYVLGVAHVNGVRALEQNNENEKTVKD